MIGLEKLDLWMLESIFKKNGDMQKMKKDLSFDCLCKQFIQIFILLVYFRNIQSLALNLSISYNFMINIAKKSSLPLFLGIIHRRCCIIFTISPTLYLLFPLSQSVLAILPSNNLIRLLLLIYQLLSLFSLYFLTYDTAS